MEVTCILCRKLYGINSSDKQYFRIKNKQTNHYVCKTCNETTQEEARSNVNYDPNLLDPKGHDKLV